MSTTSVYTHTSEDFMNRELAAAIADLAGKRARERDMTASQRKPQADGIEHGPLVRIMPWGQTVRWQLPVLMAQAQVRFAKQLHDPLHGEGVTIGHSRVHELVTEAPARLTVEVQFAICRALNCSPSDLWLDLGSVALDHQPDRSARDRMRGAKVVRAGEFL